MSHLAQDELDQYFNNHDHLRSHPEDLSRSDESDNEKTDYVTTQTVGDSDDDDDDDEEDTQRNMATMTQTRTTYQLPSTLFDANTGPKGVIADAHSFERAKKRSFRRTLMDLTNGITLGSRSSHEKTNYNNDKLSSSVSSGTSEGDDEKFMRQWREKRIQEMAAGTVRRQSPSKRKYGNLDAVDAEGFLDAVEKVPADTVVVVCIYDPEVSLFLSNLMAAAITFSCMLTPTPRPLSLPPCLVPHVMCMAPNRSRTVRPHLDFLTPGHDTTQVSCSPSLYIMFPVFLICPL